MDEVDPLPDQPTGDQFVYDEMKAPSPEQILSILDSLGLSDKDRDDLRDQLLYRQETGEFKPVEPPPVLAPSIFTSETIILITMLLILSFVFVQLEVNSDTGQLALSSIVSSFKSMDEVIRVTDNPEDLGPKVDMETVKNIADSFDPAALKDMLEKMMTIRKEAGEDVGDGDDDELKKKLAKELFSKIQQTMSVKGADMIAEKLIVFGVALLIIVLILVFFGYKLYKSLTDKERKREEKKKLKQQKKRK